MRALTVEELTLGELFLELILHFRAEEMPGEMGLYLWVGVGCCRIPLQG